MSYNNSNLHSFDPLVSNQQRVAPLPAPPSVAPSAPPTMNEDQVEFLQRQGFPKGMIHALGHHKQAFPLRVWILDNSLYMKVKDAHILRGNYENVDASRWEELQDCVAYHSQMATKFVLPVRFAMLNDPKVGPQYFTLNQTGNLPQEQQTLQHIMTQAKPGGPTLLTAQLKVLQQYIVSIAPQLQAKQQTVSIILATQGLPTDDQGVSSSQVLQEFILTLRSFTGLPIWLVLRLCTDDERTFEFYNSIDAQLILPCDVLDDFYGEAIEIYLRNPWLTYGIPLHHYREMGLRVRVLDVLDERALTLGEIRQLVHFLFVDTTNPAAAAAILPDPAVDWHGFLRVVNELQAKEQPQWNSVPKQLMPWINVAHLDAIYGAQHPGSLPTGPTPSTSAGNMPQQGAYTQQTQPMLQPQTPVAISVTPSAPIEDPAELQKVISTRWAKQPPAFQVNKPITELLGTVHVTFPLVDAHDYFLPEKSPPMSQQALASGDEAVLKRAVRKMKFFLHPDKLPKDFNRQQLLLCKTLWDTTAEAWETHRGNA